MKSLVLALLLLASPVNAQTIRLAWDPPPPTGNVETDATGFIAYRGESSRTYNVAVDVSLATEAPFPRGDTSKRYYFAVLAYNAQGGRSDLSEEVVLEPDAPTPVVCAGTLTAPAGLSSGGGTFEAAIGLNDQSCSWTLSASVPWLVARSSLSGAGAGVVDFEYSSNPTTRSRSGDLALSGQDRELARATLLQDAPPPPPPPCNSSTQPIVTVESYTNRLNLGQVGDILATFRSPVNRRIVAVYAEWGTQQFRVDISGGAEWLAGISYKPSTRGTQLLTTYAVDDANCIGRTSRTRSVQVR